MEIGQLTISLLLAAVLGFAAHRASICTVRAVAEILSTRRACCLTSFAKSVLWVMAVILPAIWLIKDPGVRLVGYQGSYMAVAGGFAFGVGSALNGGCAFSTLTRLVDGHLRMLGTLAGFVLGVFAMIEVVAAGWGTMPVASQPRVIFAQPSAIAITAILWGWALWESTRLWRSRATSQTLSALLLTTPYRLSTAAALMGLSNGLLYLQYGPWAYSGMLRHGVEGVVFARDPGLDFRVFLFAAVLAGMGLSTWHSGTFRPDLNLRPDWLINLLAGVLMGAGAALIPGGNDTLILYSIPTLSPHALPAYGGVLAGIALAMVLMRYLTGRQMHVDCAGDICRSGALGHPPRG